MEIYRYITTKNTEKGRDTGLVNLLRELCQRVCLQLYVKLLQKYFFLDRLIGQWFNKNNQILLAK